MRVSATTLSALSDPGNANGGRVLEDGLRSDHDQARRGDSAAILLSYRLRHERNPGLSARTPGATVDECAA